MCIYMKFNVQSVSYILSLSDNVFICKIVKETWFKLENEKDVSYILLDFTRLCVAEFYFKPQRKRLNQILVKFIDFLCVFFLTSLSYQNFFYLPLSNYPHMPPNHPYLKVTMFFDSLPKELGVQPKPPIRGNTAEQQL